jgi:hypothetical protein
MSVTPFVFYTYRFYSSEDRSLLSGANHFSLLSEVHRRPVSYRGEDQSTRLVILNDRNIGDRQVLSFFITRQIQNHKISFYDESRETFEERDEPTIHFPKSQIIMIPEFGKMAVSDKTGEKDIDAKSTMLRLRAIISSVGFHEMKYEYAGTIQDAKRAIENWEISEFTFDARPFNPHPRPLGQKISELLKENEVKIRGSLKGKGNEPIKETDKGMVAEIVGLAEGGYANIGAKGKTDQGFEASIAKNKLEEDENTPRKMRVFIPERADSEDMIRDIVRIMEQLYGSES